MTAPTPDRAAAPGAGDWFWPLLLIAAVSLWRLAVAAGLPPVLDEAYYFHWARTLRAGYFDHPPGVALLGIGGALAPGSVLAARLGTLLAGLLTALVLWRLYRAAGLRGGGLMLALVLALGTLPGLVGGVLTTPDTVLALAWALALHEALAALQHDRRRWLTAGLATGLGLLGKYTMLLIGPVLLWALLLVDRRALATRWPYLGGLLALLVFLPNLWWNATHDWLTLGFQFGHGFGTGSAELAVDASGLPPTTGPMPYAPVPPTPPAGLERLARLGSFLAAQIAFWGLLALPLGLAAWQGLRHWLRQGRARRGHPAPGPAPVLAPAATDQRPAPVPAPLPGLAPAAGPLLAAALWFPLGLFAALSLTSDVEPNWPVMYLIAAAPLAARWLLPWRRLVWLAAALNLVLVSLYVVHAASGRLPLPDLAERVLRETQGYRTLAAHVATLPGPVLADRYQVAAMLNFYQPGLAAAQWPGITRPSEYSRGVIAPFPALSDLHRSGFWLVARRLAAPELPGFALAETHTAFACRGRPLTILPRHVEYHDGPCPAPLRVWRVYRYLSVGADPAQFPPAARPATSRPDHPSRPSAPATNPLPLTLSLS